MNDATKYLNALKGNNGNFDEISLGETLGFSEGKTKDIIKTLLDLGEIEFQSFGLCSYRVK